MKQPTALLSSTKSKKLLLGVAAFAAVATFAVPATTNALISGDKTDVGLGLTNQNEDGDMQQAGLRVLTADQLENVGLQGMLGSKTSDGDETNLLTKVETTDSLENVAANVMGQNKTDDGDMQQAGLGLTSMDTLQDTATNLGVSNKDKDGDQQSAGLGLVTTDTLDKVTGGVTGSSTSNGDKTGVSLPFSFE